MVFALGAGAGPGITGWSAGPVDGLAGIDAVDASASTSAEPHANGVNGLDHFVVTTPDLDRTVEALLRLGLSLRRIREAGTMRQAFFKVESVVAEVVGPETPSGDGPATFWGLAFVAPDLDATASFLGDRLGAPKDAVQPGRRIATLAPAGGSSVPIAFMSPR